MSHHKQMAAASAAAAAAPRTGGDDDSANEARKRASSKFSKLGLCEPVCTTLVDKLGFSSPTDVQRQAIPAMIAGRDLLAQAPTGSGKVGVHVGGLLIGWRVYIHAYIRRWSFFFFSAIKKLENLQNTNIARKSN